MSIRVCRFFFVLRALALVNFRLRPSAVCRGLRQNWPSGRPVSPVRGQAAPPGWVRLCRFDGRPSVFAGQILLRQLPFGDRRLTTSLLVVRRGDPGVPARVCEPHPPLPPCRFSLPSWRKLSYLCKALCHYPATHLCWSLFCMDSKIPLVYSLAVSSFRGGRLL